MRTIDTAWEPRPAGGLVTYGEDVSATNSRICHTCFPGTARSCLTVAIGPERKRAETWHMIEDIILRHHGEGAEVDVIDHRDTGLYDHPGASIIWATRWGDQWVVPRDCRHSVLHLTDRLAGDRQRLAGEIVGRIASEASPSSPRIIVLPIYGSEPEDLPMAQQEFLDLVRFRPGLSVWVVSTWDVTGRVLERAWDRAHTRMAFMPLEGIADYVSHTRSQNRYPRIRERAGREGDGHFLLMERNDEFLAVVRAMSPTEERTW